MAAERLTAEEIEALRKLYAAGTTDGPWTAGDNGGLETPGGYSLLAGSGPGWVFALKADAEWTAAARNALPRLLDERDRLLAEVREWLCESCRTVYPGPPQPGFSCVICPKCDGLTGPRVSVEKRTAEAQLERARALLKRIEWGLLRDECPACGGSMQHRPGCELAALLGPK